METHGETLELTVLNGKESLAVSVPAPAADAKWLEILQSTLAERTGVAVAHQKLLFRGKQLTAAHGNDLKNGAKLMLLKNASFHTSEKTSMKADREEDTGRNDAPAAKKPAVVVTQRLGIDASEIDDEHLLVQAMRGKSVYEFLFLANATIAAVKTRVGSALGLSGDALRLILKGETPPNDAPVSNFVGSAGAARVLKCMVLLNAKQHDVMEREEEFRVIQNELTSVETDMQKLAKVMFRNFLSREEVLFRLHALEDHIGRLESNLGIVEDQLKAAKLVEGSATLKALQNAKRECGELKTQVDALSKRFDSGR